MCVLCHATCKQLCVILEAFGGLQWAPTSSEQPSKRSRRSQRRPRLPLVPCLDSYPPTPFRPEPFSFQGFFFLPRRARMEIEQKEPRPRDCAAKVSIFTHMQIYPYSGPQM